MQNSKYLLLHTFLFMTLVEISGEWSFIGAIIDLLVYPFQLYLNEDEKNSKPKFIIAYS